MKAVKTLTETYTIPLLTVVTQLLAHVRRLFTNRIGVDVDPLLFTYLYFKQTGERCSMEQILNTHKVIREHPDLSECRLSPWIESD